MNCIKLIIIGLCINLSLYTQSNNRHRKLMAMQKDFYEKMINKASHEINKASSSDSSKAPAVISYYKAVIENYSQNIETINAYLNENRSLQIASDSRPIRRSRL